MPLHTVRRSRRQSRKKETGCGLAAPGRAPFATRSPAPTRGAPPAPGASSPPAAAGRQAGLLTHEGFGKSLALPPLAAARHTAAVQLTLNTTTRALGHGGSSRDYHVRQTITILRKPYLFALILPRPLVKSDGLQRMQRLDILEHPKPL